MFASVNIKPNIVPMLGKTMPDPFAIPEILIFLLLTSKDS